LQVKLLRVLDQHRVRPLGSSADVPIDVRLVAATSRNLRELCSTNAFRLDLYYRLTGVVSQVPPLRERRDEILLLSLAMLRADAPNLQLSIEAAEKLALATWDGNIRQLRFAITHASHQANSAGQTSILAHHLPDLAPISSAIDDKLTEARIVGAMAESGGNAKLAAEILRVSRVTLYRACKQLGIELSTIRRAK
jgi:transcriptional regulator of acetoin/glycerol metabolism